jgi:RecJ-like exonuclease
MYRDHDEDDPPPLPHRWEICSRCRGEGKHCNPAIDGNGLTREDFDEDPDFAEMYFSGAYDVPCHECGGRGSVKVPDVSQMTFAQKRQYVLQLRGGRERDAAWESERYLRMAEGWE